MEIDMKNFTNLLHVLVVVAILLVAAMAVEGYRLMMQFLASFGA